MGDGGARELPPDDRGALEHGALLGPQPLDARREQRLDGRRHLEARQLDPGGPAIALALERAVVHEHADELADEERDCLRSSASTRPATAAGSSSAPITFAASRVAAPASSPASVTTSATRPPGTVSDERTSRSSGRAADEDEQRHVGAPLDQVLGQVEQQRLGPLEVVDREHDRLRRGERGEEAAHDEERLLRRRRRAGEQRGDPVGDAAALGIVAGHGGLDRRAQRVAAGALVDAKMRAQRLGDRRERGAAGRVAVRGQDGRAVAEPARDLVDEARLAEARRAEDHGEPRAPARDGRVVDRHQPPQLVVAPDERRRRCARRPLERDDAVRRDRLGAALEREDAEGLERHELAHQAPRRLADQHVAVVRLLLQARGDVQRIADAGRVVVADDDLAGVDRDAQPDVADDRALLARELAERVLDADRGAHGADGVVLGHARHAEGAHDAVAEELHDGAAVRFDRDAHRAVVAVHHAAHGLGVEPFVQRRRADEIGEHDRDHLARDGALGRRDGAGAERGAAAAAELRRGSTRTAARRTAPLEARAAFLAERRADGVLVLARRAVHGLPMTSGISSSGSMRAGKAQPSS